VKVVPVLYKDHFMKTKGIFLTSALRVFE